MKGVFITINIVLQMCIKTVEVCLPMSAHTVQGGKQIYYQQLEMILQDLSKKTSEQNSETGLVKTYTLHCLISAECCSHRYTVLPSACSVSGFYFSLLCFQICYSAPVNSCATQVKNTSVSISKLILYKALTRIEGTSFWKRWEYQIDQ